MASIYKKKSRKGKGYTWRAVIRPKGHPPICKSFNRKQEAEDWAEAAEFKVKSGEFNFLQHKNPHTFKELVERYIDDGVLEHYRAKRDAIRHLNYFNERMGNYTLPNITSDYLSKERKVLQNGKTLCGKQRTNSTVNRYIASLSAVLSYAHKHLNWIQENPCVRLKKLKEEAGRTRTLSKEEVAALLDAAKKKLLSERELQAKEKIVQQIEERADNPNAYRQRQNQEKIDFLTKLRNWLTNPLAIIQWNEKGVHVGRDRPDSTYKPDFISFLNPNFQYAVEAELKKEGVWEGQGEWNYLAME